MWTHGGKKLIKGVALLALLFAAFLDSTMGLSCINGDFDLTVPLSGGVGRVTGLNLKYHPYNPQLQAIDEDSHVLWQLGDVEEIDNSVNMGYKCDLDTDQFYPSDLGVNTYRRMRIEELDCTATSGTTELAPGVIQSYVRIDATWPAYSNFSLNLTISTANENYTQNMGNSTHTDGYDYLIEHRSTELKSTMRLNNWPWAGPNGTSFLVAAFVGAFQVRDQYGNASTSVAHFESSVFVKSGLYTMMMRNKHFMLLDDVPVLKTFAPIFLIDRSHTNISTPVAFFFLFSACRDNEPGILPHYDVLEYDPQFSSLFHGPTPSEQPPEASTPTQKKKNKDVAIAMGVVFGLVGVGLIVGAVYAFFIYVPKIERGVTTTS